MDKSTFKLSRSLVTLLRHRPSRAGTLTCSPCSSDRCRPGYMVIPLLGGGSMMAQGKTSVERREETVSHSFPCNFNKQTGQSRLSVTACSPASPALLCPVFHHFPLTSLRYTHSIFPSWYYLYFFSQVLYLTSSNCLSLPFFFPFVCGSKSVYFLIMMEASKINNNHPLKEAFVGCLRTQLPLTVV